MTVELITVVNAASEYHVSVPTEHVAVKVELWGIQIVDGEAETLVGALVGVGPTVIVVPALDGLSHPVVLFTHLAV